MAGGVPGEVVMDDAVEKSLEVYSFGKTVSRHENRGYFFVQVGKGEDT